MSEAGQLTGSIARPTRQISVGLSARVATPSWTAIRAVGYAVAEARNGITALNALRLYAGTVVSTGVSLSIPELIVPLLAWAGVSITGYALNGCTDVEADRANGSSRPIASGRLSLRAAYASTGLIAAVTVILALVVNVAFFLHVMAGLTLGVAYSVGRYALKNSTVTAALSMCSGVFLSLNAGRVVVNGSVTTAFVCVVIASMIWIVGAAVAKDISDVNGDRLAGRATYAATAGRSKAQRLATTLLFLGAVPIVVGALYTPLLWWPGAAVAAVVGPLLLRLMRRQTSPRGHLTSLISTNYVGLGSSLLI